MSKLACRRVRAALRSDHVQTLAAIAAATVLAAPSPANIVPQLGLSTVEPLAVAKALSAQAIHGDRDDGLSRWGLRSAVGRRPLSLTCGPVVAFVQSELASFGIRSRAIQLHAAGTPNGFDDGHVLLEVETANGPVLVDVDQKRLFLIGGRPASSSQIAREGFEAVTLASFAPAKVDPEFAIAAHVAAIHRNPRPWYARMFAQH